MYIFCWISENKFIRLDEILAKSPIILQFWLNFSADNIIYDTIKVLEVWGRSN